MELLSVKYARISKTLILWFKKNSPEIRSSGFLFFIKQTILVLTDILMNKRTI